MTNFFKNTWEKIEKHLTLLKIIFVVLVLIFVVHELIHDFHEINGDQVLLIFSQQSFSHLCLMFVLGFIAVLPMLNYDFNIVKFLPGTFNKLYILRAGWACNTFTNIAGFGGFLGAALRANFYSKGASKKEILFAISKIALFLLTGLSLLCWIASFLVYILHIGYQFNRYWLFLFGGALYFPILLLITHKIDGEFFDGLTEKRQFSLMTGSSLEWISCCTLFILIGFLMGNKTNWLAIIPIFVISSIIGVISMIPGGLGSFDACMLSGLSILGLGKADVLVWLLLYRLFYYVFPFILGVVFFIHDLGHKVNRTLDEIPMQLFRKLAHYILVGFLWFSGIMIILVATFPKLQDYNQIYSNLYGYVIYFANQVTNIIVGFILIILARGVSSRVKKSFWPTTIVFLIGSINTLWKDPSIKMLIFLSIVLLALMISKKGFYRTNFQYSWGALGFDIMIFGAIMITYIIVGLYNMPNYQEQHHVSDMILFPSEHVWLSGLVAMFLSIIISWGLYIYIHDSKHTRFINNYDYKRINKLINEYGNNEVSHLAYLRDKYFYFYQEQNEDKLFFMYRKMANKLIVMGEPIGDYRFINKAINAFMNDADKEGYSIVFYEINDQLTMDLHESGYDFLKFGEEGFVDLSCFSMEGKKRKSDRNLMSKFEREGYKFEEITPPFSEKIINELRNISDEWLHGRRESGFSMGFFSEYYLNKSSVYVIRNNEGKIIAFTTNMPQGDNASIDLMRYSDDAPTGTMDVMFINLFKLGIEKGKSKFNLGMAPLSNVGTSRFSFIEEKIARFIYEYGYNFYSFQGLRKYKDKYASEWHSKYIAFRKRNSLIFTMVQILLTVNRKINKKEAA